MLDNSQILNELYKSFDLAIEYRQYKKAFLIFLKSLRFSLLYFLKTIFTQRRKYKTYMKEIFFRLKYRLPLFTKGIDVNSNVIISLTSYPARFPTLHICLKSLLQQKVQKPAYVVLYLDEWVNINSIPWQVRRLQKYGLKIKIECKNLKPHNKYYYAMKEYQDKCIITVDDDQIYPHDLVQSLYASYKKYPNVISARRVMRIKRNVLEIALPSNSWEGECTSIMDPSMELLAQGVGGILYPPHIFDISQPYFCIENIIQYCQMADDMWLKFIEKKNKIPVVWVVNKLRFHAIHYEHRLMNTNVIQENNDIFINRCETFFEVQL